MKSERWAESERHVRPFNHELTSKLLQIPGNVRTGREEVRQHPYFTDAGVHTTAGTFRYRRRRQLEVGNLDDVIGTSRLKFTLHMNQIAIRFGTPATVSNQQNCRSHGLSVDSWGCGIHSF